jgi:PhnB protein
MTQPLVVPYLIVNGAARAFEFYAQAFGAVEVLRLTEPGGRVGHGEIRIGESRVMLADEYPEHGILGPQARGGTTVSLNLSVADADAVTERAVAAGAKLLKAVADQFYGERSGQVEDPFGHVWHVSARTEDVSPEEMQRRFAALFA